jgi:hypothetical protein
MHPDMVIAQRRVRDIGPHRYPVSAHRRLWKTAYSRRLFR